MNKSVFQPAMQMEFQGQQIDSNLDQLLMTPCRQKKINQMLGRWRRIVVYHQMVKSEILGQFYRVTEFPATTIQERRDPSEEAKQDQIIGSPAKRLECIDNSQHVGIEKDILVEVDSNKKQTDLSYNSSSSGNTSNRCESCTLERDAENARSGSGSAANLCAFRRSVSYQKERQIKSLKIDTDNSSAAYNINRCSAAVAIAKLVDRTLETAEVLNLQLHAFHIPGVTNRIPDSLSRLATSGDY
ncbi:MAG: hypothetical protein EZS28_049351, partial [Streblomastix strix]